MRTFRAGVVQLCSRGDVDANLATVRRLVAGAVRDGAELVAVPENYAWLRVPGCGPAPIGPVDGELTREMANLAREHGIHLLLGAQREGAPDDPKHYNTSILLDPAGEVRAAYRKRHLFDIDLPDGTSFRESDLFLPGDELVVAETDLAAIGLSICYDLRFPEHYRGLVDRGAEVLTSPSAFTHVTGSAHWHLLNRTRAVESQCFVLAPDQAGRHGGDRHSYGHSLVIDPWGDVLAEVTTEEGWAVATLDADRLADVRRRLPCLQHRR